MTEPKPRRQPSAAQLPNPRRQPSAAQLPNPRRQPSAPRPANPAAPANVSIESVVGLRERTPLQGLFASQAFWVTVALVIICLVMSWLQPAAFATQDNFYNITRNFAFIGIMALGMTAVIVTGGIDLSVGSIMGVVAIVCGLILQAGGPWWAAIAAASPRVSSAG